MISPNDFILFCVSVTIATDYVYGECRSETGILRLYKELGCKASKFGDDKCPTAYSCPPVTASSNTCTVRGKTYKSGEEIAASKGSCVTACRCTQSWPNMDRSSVTCAHIDCPEFFGEPIMDGCVRQYSLDHCCSIGVKCPSLSSIVNKTISKESPVVPNNPAFTCNVSGVEYPEGAVFYPDEPSCTHCVCTKDYNGSKTGPWCREIACDTELHNGSELQEGCTPVYFGNDGCCPIQFRCPSTDDVVVKSTKENEKKLDGKAGHCTFGNLTLNIGDKLSPQEYEECIDCICEVPPHVSCVKMSNC